MKNNKTRLHKGLHTDNSPQDQPKGTHRFSLNSVREDGNGNDNFESNENSNEPCASFPEGYIPIGKEYIGNGKTAIFLVKEDESLSEIGIVDEECNYETHVNFDLGFKITNQIEATYRLRRGCERTIYFLTPKPMIYNFDKSEDFKNGVGDWDTDKFSLFKTYSKIPNFLNIDILESGQLPPGSYNASIQYLDEDFNPTEFITTTDTIIIYNDKTGSKPFSEIRGSTNNNTDYQDFGVTNKAIKFTLSSLDTDFPFYRIAIIEANNGSGQISRVVYSQKISTKIDTYIYTGGNAVTEGTVEEIQEFNNIIESGEHIEQIENRLIIANTKGKQIDFCELQKYASLITADLVTEEIVLNDINSINNQKRGQLHTEKIGYMPGEIYSFGIVYIFEDGTISPVYHIPGRNQKYDSEMSLDNSLSATYTDNNNCNNKNYWGIDSQGEELEDTNIRQHRFPLRSEVNKPLFEKIGEFGDTVSIDSNQLLLDISDYISSSYTEEYVNYVVTYDIDGNPQQYTGSVRVDTYDGATGLSNIIIDTTTGTITNIQFFEIDDTSAVVAPFSGLVYNTEITAIQATSIDDDAIYKSEIFGIKFSNINLPSFEDTNGEKIIGYYIVRNERTEEEKTILDSGILSPLLEETGVVTGDVKFMSHGHLLPNSDRINKETFALIHPEHRFKGKEYTNTTSFIQEGEYIVDKKTLSDDTIQDVQPGTSYDSSAHKRRERDTDGFSLHVLNRNHTLNYQIKTQEFANINEIESNFYLDTLFSKVITDLGDNRKDVYNLSADNKIGILQLNKEYEFNNKLPYVIMKREIENVYGNFRVLPYYKETNNPVFFTSDINNEISIFNGDSYISSMRYMSSMFYDIRIKDRKRKKGLFNFIIGILSIIVGALLFLPTGGASVIIIGFGVAQIATGIEKDQIAKVYKDLYEQGLKETVNDTDTDSYFAGNPADDTIQWFFDSASNFWFESSVNMNWRMGATIGLTDFLNSPVGFNQEQTLQYCIDKITVPDSENDDGRTYQGFAKAEIYEMNPDYRRRNKEKIFSHLGLEYDCCSDCLETFPHRNHYSEQSFQEELTDNYRTFLPNNYSDIEGETGEITNIFRIQNNLYIHTEEALWHLPQNIQERVTGEVVSFIGTGSFFSIPPRLIVDGDNGHSAGSKHKWATLKTPYGVFFVSEKQRTFYQFNGNNLKPISNIGKFNWFKNNTTLQIDDSYYKTNKRDYPFKNNPSNPHGSGFISVYDSKNERVIFTKKDLLFSSIESDDYELCMNNGKLYIFNNFSENIFNKENLGWSYLGIENCKLKFFKRTNATNSEYSYINSELIENLETLDNSWTMSYTLRSNPNSWQSYHSYLPNFYIYTPNTFHSWKYGDSTLWRHNKKGHYQNFYGKRQPFIIEFVSLSNPLITKVWDYIRLITEAKKFNPTFNEFNDERFITFNKGLFYNSRQCSGVLNLMVKDVNVNSEDYLLQQVKNLTGDSIIIDRNERDWTLNNIRDIRVNYKEPIFNSKLINLQDNYYIDKIVNENSIDYNKDWFQLESFRDKYLIIRLIFDTYDDIKLLLNYSIENEQQSYR